MSPEEEELVIDLVTLVPLVRKSDIFVCLRCLPVEIRSRSLIFDLVITGQIAFKEKSYLHLEKCSLNIEIAVARPFRELLT